MNRFITGLLTIGLITALSLTAYGAKTVKVKTGNNEVIHKKDIVIEEKHTNLTKVKNVKWGLIIKERDSAQKDIDKMNADIVKRQTDLAYWQDIIDSKQAEVDAVILKPQP